MGHLQSVRSAKLPLLQCDSIECFCVAAQKALIAAEFVLGGAADLGLHPLTVSIAEPKKFAGIAQLRLSVIPVCKGCVGGRSQNIRQGILGQISQPIGVNAVKVTGINTSVSFHHQLGMAATVDAAGGGHPVSQQIYDIVKQFHTAVFSNLKVRKP